MSHAEYVEWNAFHAIEPFGHYREDWQAAIVAAASQAPHSKQPVEPSKFLPFPPDRFNRPDEDEDAWDDILERAAQRAARAEHRRN